MDFKKIDKEVLVFILVLIVIGGIYLWQNYGVGQKYFDNLKSVFSRISPVKFVQQLFNRVNPFQARVFPELLPAQDLGEINLGNLLPKGKILSGAGEEEEVVVGAKEETETTNRQLTLDEIQEEINRIIGEVEEVGQEVNKLEALTEIQKEINNIKKETEVAKQEVNKLKTLVEIQEEIDEIAEKTDILTQEITRLT